MDDMKERNDLIRRGDAIDLCVMAIDDSWEYDYATDRMFEIPAVDAVEVRHGWWEDVEIVDEDIVAENHTMIASMFCPVCKRYASTVYHYGNPLDMMNYCPNCGAQMMGGAEDG